MVYSSRVMRTCIYWAKNGDEWATAAPLKTQSTRVSYNDFQLSATDSKSHLTRGENNMAKYKMAKYF